MKSFKKSALGVTLLEIMLVLAIAAMIIVMSVRYYQSATTSQQANQVMSQLQAISSAMDNLSQATGSYAGLTGDNLKPLLGQNGLATPWGTQTDVAGAAGSYTVTIPSMPAGVCTIVTSQLQANENYTGTSSDCGSTADFTTTYKANP